MGRKRDYSEFLLDVEIYLSPRKPRKVIDTPRRTRILQDYKTLKGSVTQREIFRRHGVSLRSGRRILASGSARTS